MAGTLGMMALLYGGAPRLVGAPVDVVEMLVRLFGTTWETGFALHLLAGAYLFPLLYARAAYPRFSGAPWRRGALWGLLLWLLAELVVAPEAGAGAFHSEAGGRLAAGASLAGHLLYGVLLGAIAGPTRASRAPKAILLFPVARPDGVGAP